MEVNISKLLDVDNFEKLSDSDKNIEQKKIQKILSIIAILKDKGFLAYMIGGCVRDLIMNRVPKDWDITTNALPDDVVKLFDHTYSQNTKYGTVGIVFEEEGEKDFVVEVTTFRKEYTYSNQRHPDEIKFCDSIEEDLKRRDFTINAIAFDPIELEIIDLVKGIGDIEKKIIKTVGKPEDRFEEDLLRILRAIRISTELDFNIDDSNFTVIKEYASKINNIAKERISAEFTKIIMSDNPKNGIELLHKANLLKEIIPDLEKGIGCNQNQAHTFDVFEHNLRTLQHAADNDCPLYLRLSALLHDVAKPHTRDFSKEKNDWTFYSHEVVGANLSKKIMGDLKYPKDLINTVYTLIRWHMFFSDTQMVTLSAVRRLISRVGKDRIWDLIMLRRCDRIGTGRPKEQPYNLRKFMTMIDEVLRDPISVGMLKINGEDIIKLKGDKVGGPYVGYILYALLDEVLDDPKKNDEKLLLERAGEFLKLPEKELAEIGNKGKNKIGEEESKEIKEMRNKRGIHN